MDIIKEAKALWRNGWFYTYALVIIPFIDMQGRNSKQKLILLFSPLISY